MKVTSFCLLLLSLFCFSTLRAIEPAAANTGSDELVELFSTEDNPGEGTLEYKSATETEKIALGKDAGFFGLGMTFTGNLLPEGFRKDFSKDTIIQIALGSLKSKLGTKLPQFGAATLITDALPKSPTTFTFIVPDNKQPKKNKHTAFLLFTSPNAKANQSDEEKLKTTYFAKSGTLVLTPLGLPVQVSVRNEGSKVTFKRQMMRAELDATLATPFNGVPRDLKGAVSFPFYWPYGRAAEQLTTRISGATLPGGVQVPSAAPHRKLANQPKKK